MLNTNRFIFEPENRKKKILIAKDSVEIRETKTDNIAKDFGTNMFFPNMLQKLKV